MSNSDLRVLRGALKKKSRNPLHLGRRRRKTPVMTVWQWLVVVLCVALLMAGFVMLVIYFLSRS